MSENKIENLTKSVNMRMLPVISGFIILLVPLTYAEGNSCISCHSKDYTKTTLAPWVADSFEVWSRSVHGVSGVTCDSCHGGDPGAVDREGAHVGVLGSSDPGSPVYYRNVPETCGKCHSRVYEKFVQSKHYRNLKAGKLAPTCTTCHGFRMNIQKVNPIKISTKCSSLCHNQRVGAKPGMTDEAKRILVLQKMVEKDISKAHNLIREAKKEGGDTARASEVLNKADLEFKESWYIWHAFDLSNFQRALLEASESARASYSTSLSVIRGEPETTAYEKSLCGPSIIVLLAAFLLLGRGVIKNGGIK